MSSLPPIIKRRHDQPADFFHAEARGLRTLDQASGLRVPTVLSVGDDYIELENLGQGNPQANYWHDAAVGLAQQHAINGDFFGFATDGYCGDTPQRNTPNTDGWQFFAYERLLYQADLALHHGLLPQADHQQIRQLSTELAYRIPPMPPVLLHGDLWLGNLHVCADGTPALIDAAAVHYGWAETDLAMLCLFGAPPPRFFETYARHAELRSDWRQRLPVYNLYHLLNHLNLFGTNYLPAVRQAWQTWQTDR